MSTSPGSDDGYEAVDNYEDKLVEAIEAASEKSLNARINAMEFISKGLRHRFDYDFLDSR